MSRSGRGRGRGHHGGAGRDTNKDDDMVRLSKNLTYVLRHKAETMGFSMLVGGFLPVEDILKHHKFSRWTSDDVEKVVASCEKQRFSLATDPTTGKLLIRANQGHSMKDVQVDMEEITSPDQVEKVIHGTTSSAWESIRTQGLSRMNRQHIHFAPGEPGDAQVISGMRSNSSTIYIYIDLQHCLEDGLKFYRSANNVILSPGDANGVIPVKYFRQVRDVKRDVQIYP